MRANVDWSQAPKGARWWSMDGDGRANWFSAPNVVAHTDFWFSEPMPAPSFGYVGNWRESLVERPSK